MVLLRYSYEEILHVLTRDANELRRDLVTEVLSHRLVHLKVWLPNEITLAAVVKPIFGVRGKKNLCNDNERSIYR